MSKAEMIKTSQENVPSGFILKLFQMVNGAPDEVIRVSLYYLIVLSLVIAFSIVSWKMARIFRVLFGRFEGVDGLSALPVFTSAKTVAYGRQGGFTKSSSRSVASFFRSVSICSFSSLG